MSKVYFKSIDSILKTEEINNSVFKILEKIVKEENIKLEKVIPLKVHFGEKGNITYIKPKNYKGIIKFLEKNKIKSFYTDTNVLYKGERMTSSSHKKLAIKHGFTNLPIKIADGKVGENFKEIRINKKHFKTCKIGGVLTKYKQILVISHFKGHMLAGFGGAIKQLAMGFASRGGKLAQHVNSKPSINKKKCVQCKICKDICPVNAITITENERKIDKTKCVGCASCIAICPQEAISIGYFGYINSIFGFTEKLAEYALGASKNKNHIYINYVFNLTKNCDCSGTKMKPFLKDLGILVSLDPVSIDNASIELLEKREGKKNLFRNKKILDYAQKIGLGKKEYELIIL